MRATAESLEATFEQMKAVEELRRALRDAKGIGKVEPN
jgi:hypothetical protein